MNRDFEAFIIYYLLFILFLFSSGEHFPGSHEWNCRSEQNGEVDIWFLNIENSQDRKMLALICKLSKGIKYKNQFCF